MSKSSFSSKKNNLYICLLIILLIVIIIGVIMIVFKKYNKHIEFFENNKKYDAGINNVDKILFINLEARKDRLESITSELKKQNVSEDKIHRINAHYTPGNGHLGCSKSHYDALQYAIDNDLNNVLIFEDDFLFSASSKDLFDNLFNQLETKEWDVILLTYSWGNTSDSKYPFLNKLTEAQSGAGYIVNKHYFKTLQDVFKESADNMTQEKTSKVDFEPYALDQLWKKLQKKDNWFCFKPLLGKQDDKSTSTIQSITNYKET
jgi:GR25 family glycosyltransferase involved in LPS biosynthesis